MARDPRDQTQSPIPGLSLETRLTQLGRAGVRIRGFVNPPLVRGSTVLHNSCAERREAGRHRLEQELIYGLLGTPTHFALENALAAIEGGTRCQIVSSGLAAITTSLLAYLGTGDHCLVPDSVYGPTRHFCDTLLRQAGVETTYYVPTIDPDSLAALFRPNTKVLFLESPGSHTFEMQDVPALARVAHARGAAVLMDNTWGILFFQPFAHGVDVSIQALTKYVGGHSDIILGGIITARDSDWEKIRNASMTLGQYASPDDCWLALRGLRTLAARLKQQMESGLKVARWLATRAEVYQVLYPALPGAPGHAIWRRDYSGACSLFGVVFQPDIAEDSMIEMIDSLELFGIGASWGGFESLALPTTGTIRRTAAPPPLAGPAARFHIGLEDPNDLIADLERAFKHLRRV
ncbi:MAG: cystathionine beta-lyase [Acidobacteriia bacterium]|nr:cystathionine beta-lyase [Methyloceanibacter sp.]MCL6490895.1 cystathionine beta-lyase [Terriglobia bacterium]